MVSAKIDEPPLKSDRLPSLDGLRAIAISMVLLGHLGGTRGFVYLDFGVGDYAHLGVVVFFVISGFLITSLLLNEHAKRGRISLKLFYARRALRIFPASYAFIGCLLLLWTAGRIELRSNDVWHAVTYTVNYYPFPSWQVGHLWSLSVEEQFYLLWPFAFMLLGPRRAIWVAAGVILLGPAARVGNWLFLRGTPYGDLAMFPMVADSLAAGCLLAQIRGWLEGQTWYLQLFRPGYSILLAGMVLLLNRFMAYTVISVFGAALTNIALAILIHRSVYHSRDWIGHALNWTPVASLGVLSYSLYLWQQLFIDRSSRAWIAAFPQNLLLAIAVALASYLLLERPLMKLRHRLRAQPYPHGAVISARAADNAAPPEVCGATIGE